MRTASLVALLSLAGCSTAPASAPTSASPTSPVAAPVAAPAPPATIPEYVDELHAAKFEGEALDNCIDLVRVFEGPLRADWTPASPVESALSIDAKRGEFQIRRSCNEQFTMEPLAVCRVTRPSSAGLAHRLESRVLYYRYATALETHTNMKDCIAAGGDWQAVALNSREAIRARAERNVDRALGLARISTEFAKQMESVVGTRR